MSDTAAAPAAAPLDDLFASRPTSTARSFTWSDRARPLRGVHGWLRACLYLYILGAMLTLVLAGAMLWLFALFAQGLGGEDTRTVLLAVIVQFLAELEPYATIGSLVICIIFYLLFVYQATRNLDVSDARGLDISPGGAVGWSFVPFIQLVMIFRVMKQIWEVSADPVLGRQSAPALLRWWWGLWLGSNLLARISNGAAPAGAEFADPATFHEIFAPTIYLSVAANTASILSTVCLLMIVRQVVRFQEALRTAQTPKP